MNRRHFLTSAAGTLRAFEQTSERWFGPDNHSLMPQLSGSPRLSLKTL